MIGWVSKLYFRENYNRKIVCIDFYINIRVKYGKGIIAFEQLSHYLMKHDMVIVKNMAIFKSKKIKSTIHDAQIESKANSIMSNGLVDLSMMIENIPMAVLLIDEERRVRKANKKAVKFANSSASLMQGRRGGEAINCVNSSDDPRGCGFGPSCASCSVRRVISDTFVKGLHFKDIETELTVINQGARENLVLRVSTALINISEERLSLVFIDDITERKLVERRLEHLASFPKENPNPVIEIDSQGEVTLYNKATMSYLLAIGAKEDANIFLPDDISMFVSLLNESSGNSSFVREVQINERTFSESIHILKKLNVIRIYASDITERKNKEKELVKLNHTLKAIGDSSMAISRATDESEYLKEVCRIITEDCGHALAWIGFKQDDEARSVRPMAFVGFEDGYLEALNISWADTDRGRGPTGTAIRTGTPSICANMQTDPRFKPWRAEALKRGYNSSLVVPLIAGGEVFGAISIYSRESDSFSEEEISLLVKLAEDVSHGITALRMKIASKKAEEEKNKFIAVMSHELRNPLTPILTGSQLVLALLEKSEPDGWVDYQVLLESSKLIEQQALNMSNLLDDLLDITRISRGKIDLKKQPINLLDCIENAIKTTHAVMSAQKHELSVLLTDSPLYAFADPLRIEQVIINLLNNAAKYTQPHGRITLEARRKGTEAEITVRDNGIGIEADKLNSIFDQFCGSDNAFVSTLGELGIGLKLAKDLVNMHGGAIVPKSDGAGMGSEFKVVLPAMPENYTLENSPKKLVVPRKQKRRVLIIDDNLSITKLLKSSVNYLGYEAEAVNDGPSAINLAKEFKPHIVLIDLGLPGMNGYEIAHALRAIEDTIGHRLKLLALTGYGQDEDKKRTKEAGFDVHLVKPVDIGLLDETLGSLFIEK